jgi:hypothetical protein
MKAAYSNSEVCGKPFRTVHYEKILWLNRKKKVINEFGSDGERQIHRIWSALTMVTGVLMGLFPL